MMTMREIRVGMLGIGVEMGEIMVGMMGMRMGMQEINWNSKNKIKVYKIQFSFLGEIKTTKQTKKQN